MVHGREDGTSQKANLFVVGILADLGTPFQRSTIPNSRPKKGVKVAASPFLMASRPAGLKKGPSTPTLATVRYTLACSFMALLNGLHFAMVQFKKNNLCKKTFLAVSSEE